LIGDRRTRLELTGISTSKALLREERSYPQGVGARVYAATESFRHDSRKTCFRPAHAIPTTGSEEKLENTQPSYPGPTASPRCSFRHRPPPEKRIFLSADAYVRAAIQWRAWIRPVRHYFLSGYKPPRAGTERGVPSLSPSSSPASRRPFLGSATGAGTPHAERPVPRHHADVWNLTQAGLGGPYGVGQRMSIAHYRAIVAGGGAVRAARRGQRHSDLVVRPAIPTRFQLPTGSSNPLSTGAYP